MTNNIKKKFQLSYTDLNSKIYDKNFSTFQSYKKNSKLLKSTIPSTYLTTQDTYYTITPSSRLLKTNFEKEKNEQLPKIYNLKVNKSQFDKDLENVNDFINVHYYNNEKLYLNNIIDNKKFNYYDDIGESQIQIRKKKFEGINKSIYDIKKTTKIMSVILDYFSPIFGREKFKKLKNQYKIKIQKAKEKENESKKYVNTKNKVYIDSLFRLKYK
jgi:hypothetical protein